MKSAINAMGRSSLFLLLVIIIYGIVSCAQLPEPLPVTPLEAALAQAGENRKELEKVLARYRMNSADSLKYRAACFLIENMPYYTFREGEQLDHYMEYYAILKAIRGRGIDAEVAADSIKKMYGNYNPERLRLKRDIEVIDSAFLCRNIDGAFKVWHEQPWGKNVSFDDFCEYILPYRIGDEKLEDWRDEFYKKYNPLLDSLRASDILDKEDPIQAVFCISAALTKNNETYFTSLAPASLPHVGPTVSQLKCGSCRELSDFVIYVCRALGLPCSIDFMPIRGNDNVGHFWVSFWDKYGELYFQEYPDPIKLVRNAEIRNVHKIKVYRQTFSLNRKMQDEMFALDSVVAPLFKRLHFMDVTYPYTRDYKEKLTIPSSAIYKDAQPSSRIAYLCVSQQFLWNPVAWTVFNRDSLTFRQVGRGGVMRVATIENGKFAYWTDPFYIDASNEIHYLAAKDSVQDVVVLAKFNLFSEFFRGRLLGGVFEGSNDAAFKQKDTLYVINEIPERLNTVVKVTSRKAYRYVRYYGANGSNCNIAEAVFFGMNDTDTLRGKVIGTPGCVQEDGSHEYTNVFDGKSWTSFDYKEPSGGWAGLDLGKPEQISGILFTPRNRDNYIRPGDDFELFYCDKTWKSLGRTQSEGDSLLYKGVPKDALLLLKNYSRGAQIRIFTYEKGKQIWR